MKNLRDIRFVRSSDLEFHEAVKICFILQLNTARKSETPLTNNFTCKRFDLETYTYLCDKRKINHCPHPDFFRQNIVNYRTAMKEDIKKKILEEVKNTAYSNTKTQAFNICQKYNLDGDVSFENMIDSEIPYIFKTYYESQKWFIKNRKPFQRILLHEVLKTDRVFIKNTFYRGMDEWDCDGDPIPEYSASQINFCIYYYFSIL